MTLRDRAALLATVSETTWREQVITWLKRAKWRVYAIHDSRTQEWDTDAGWPDICAVRGNRFLAIELKAKTGRLRPSQTAWRIALEGVPCVEWYSWRPSDEARVLEVLR
jgi:hypothetical protein